MSNKSLISGWQQHWNRSLFRFLGRRVRASVDIEDLAQETYLRLLRARDLSDVRNPQAYLLRVAGHVVLEWRERQSNPDVTMPLEEDLLTDECAPELELEADLSQHRFEQTLAELSPLMRAVLLMRFRDQSSYKEIARALGITERQVKRHLARGYERFRAALES